MENSNSRSQANDNTTDIHPPEVPDKNDGSTLHSAPSQTFPSRLIQSEETLTSHGGPPQPKIDVLQNPLYVTPLDTLGAQPEWVDCPHCRRRTKSRVTRVPVEKDNEGLMACLLCLVCPCLICLACMGRDEAINHFCTGDGCGHQLTHKPPKGPIQVMKVSQPKQMVSQFGVQQQPNMEYVSQQELPLTPKERYEQQMKQHAAGSS